MQRLVDFDWPKAAPPKSGNQRTARQHTMWPVESDKDRLVGWVEITMALRNLRVERVALAFNRAGHDYLP